MWPDHGPGPLRSGGGDRQLRPPRPRSATPHPSLGARMARRSASITTYPRRTILPASPALILSRTASAILSLTCSSRNCRRMRVVSTRRPFPSRARARIWSPSWLCFPRRKSSSPRMDSPGELTLRLDTVQVEVAGYGSSTREVSATRSYPQPGQPGYRQYSQDYRR